VSVCALVSRFSHNRSPYYLPYSCWNLFYIHNHRIISIRSWEQCVPIFLFTVKKRIQTSTVVNTKHCKTKI